MTKLPRGGDPLAMQPGTYLVEIASAQEGRSKNSTLMWTIGLKAVAYFGAKLCDDRLMMEGGGANITERRLDALGFPPEQTEADASDLIGRRVYVAVKSVDYKGRRKLEVDIEAPGSDAGYWHEKKGPDHVMAPDTPFG